MELPLEEGYVYGKAPKPPSAVPDITAMFDHIGVPKGKLGELPYSKEWYEGSKERARLREIEVEQLYSKKDELRGNWAHLVADGLDSWGQRVDVLRHTKGPTVGLLELLARAAHERPFDEERIDILSAKADQTAQELARLTVELDSVYDHLSHNQDQVLKKEAEDLAAENQRKEEKRLEQEKRARIEKELARQAALLAGEEWNEEEEEFDDHQQREDEVHALEDQTGAGESPEQAGGKADFLKEPSPSAAPELRGGLGRQLPPLPTPPEVQAAGGLLQGALLSGLLEVVAMVQLRQEVAGGAPVLDLH
eukprot:CAMPEP_0206465962 /NCGR_PEP_ID=MMETSP0324_2-20121206/28159_1 /ASSEMBLY_ACC=CAM_ASM_000836 /TAXON_ID=2866 /ORGANISM="Crypthecodinium cohnii, Strain Seligo" /LENGTH=307 /DNA_ID=CAMNT_0053938955 /DNA_START=8 /DNA_END=932 /DNA_ORIENTATION=+